MKTRFGICAVLIFTCGIFIFPAFAQSESALSFYNKGLAEFQKKNYTSATEFYSEAIKSKPDFFQAYQARGTSYLFSKEYEKAIDDFTKAIELKPDNTGSFMNRSSAYAQIKDYKKAIADLNQVLFINSDSAEALSNRAGIFRRLKDYKSAIEDYTRALKIKIHYSTYQGRCFANYEAENFDAAVADCSQAISLFPQSASTYYYRAKAQAKIGQNDLAAADFRKALEIDPALTGAKTELDKLLKNEKY